MGPGVAIERAAVASAGPGGAPRGCRGPRQRRPLRIAPAARGADEGGSSRCLAGGRRGGDA